MDRILDIICFVYFGPCRLFIRGTPGVEKTKIVATLDRIVRIDVLRINLSEEIGFWM
jgi:midasin (ATPase involved in ribosome maturation)